MSCVLGEIEGIVGKDSVLTDPAELLAYECDGLTFHRCAPHFVVFPETTEQIASLVRLAARNRLPFVARGAGTGLSGGARASRGGLVIETSRMRRLL
jgi:glycolate oxidase